MSQGTAPGMTRRERLRAATVDEILGTARQLLVEQGAEATSLRAIAREMGMTAPALYRYFASHEALLEGLCEQLKWELFGELEAARDAQPDQEPLGQLFAVQRAFRGWAIAHPAEFSLVFASVRPVAGDKGPDPSDPGHEMALRFGQVFLELLVRLWQQTRFPVRDAGEFSPPLRAQLERFVAVVGRPLPVGLAYVFLAGWARLYGMVALEVFGHLGFALTDVEPMFEMEINQFAADLATGG
ncbi:MAG: TetR/AcrR family transcriptional regulator [Micromonosporaceae bacterium]